MACQNDINSTSQNIMQLSKYRSTLLDILCNFQNIVQLLEIYDAIWRHVYLFGTCTMHFREVMVVVPGCSLLVGKVSVKWGNLLGKGNLRWSHVVDTASLH